MEVPSYLLKYVSNKTYNKILKNNELIIENLVDNRVDVDLNIRHLLSLGVKNIDVIVEERLDDLLLEHKQFIKKIDKYIEKLTKEGLIDMLENS